MNRNEILRSVGLIKHSKNEINCYTTNINETVDTSYKSEDAQRKMSKLAKNFVLQIPLTLWFKRQRMEMIQFILKRRIPKPKPGIPFKAFLINK
jgi:hypothetical protein